MPETFYLRFLGGSDPTWLRRGLFASGFSHVGRRELASEFATKEEAAAYAFEFHLEEAVELVTVSAEKPHAA